jgi:hypothetical protein
MNGESLLKEEPSCPGTFQAAFQPCRAGPDMVLLPLLPDGLDKKHVSPQSIRIISETRAELEGAGMAKKITLTVNESLFSKIDQWRSSFNLSKLFQDAVSEAIKAKEEFHRMMSGSEDIPRIVERLKAEKRSWLDKAQCAGETDGSTWAGKAHYKELVTVLAQLDALKASSPDTGTPPEAEELCVEAWIKRENVPDADSSGHSGTALAYRTGWRTGVRGLWDMVKDQLDD